MNIRTDRSRNDHATNPKRSAMRRLAVLAAVAVTAGGALAPGASSVEAWTGSAAGARGSVTVPTIYVGDLLMPAGYSQFTLFGNVGPRANRIPGSVGTQTIKARYYVQRWNGTAWTNVATSPVLSGTMSASQTSVVFTRPYLQPTVARGYFRVTYGFDWFNSAGVLQGSTFVTSNASSDHVCVTPARLCVSSGGYVQTGRDRYSW